MRIVNYNNTGCTLCYYDSVSSIANVQVSEVNMDRWTHTIRNEDVSWIGIAGGRARLREAVELYGWKEGVDRGLEAFGELTAPKLPSIRRKRGFRDYGHAINMSRVYSGSAHKAWSSSRRELTDKKISKKGLVNVVVDFSTSCRVGSDRYFWRGALGVLLAKALMNSGRKVRILAALSCTGFKSNGNPEKSKGEKNLTSIIQVKDFIQPLEYNTMFAVTALAGFYRHYQFKVILSMPCRVGAGLGYPDTVVLDRMAPIIDDNPVIIIENIWDKETAKRKANNIVKELEQ